ncbi:aldo/keto reductase [Phytomonospora sp. NPDC050363]|uniref:aldo/keto reductase n=1 Tax=Phytomonospora sp. NPDC050363 TaxID=3155642 RepID=UPI0033F4C4C9
MSEPSILCRRCGRSGPNPLEETMEALTTAVRADKAQYVGNSSYTSGETIRAADILRDLGVPLLVNQSSLSMIDRWTEQDRLLDALSTAEGDFIASSPLARWLLTDRYMHGVPSDYPAATSRFLTPEDVTPERLRQVAGLQELAGARGQSTAQPTLSWTFRSPRVTSALIGVSSVAQLEPNARAVEQLAFDDDELTAIDSLLTPQVKGSGA